jgi:hypothetical protein
LALCCEIATLGPERQKVCQRNSVARDDNASRTEEGLAMAAAWPTSASNGFFGANHLIFRTARHHEQA